MCSSVCSVSGKCKSWSFSWSHVIWFACREATPPPHPSSQLEAYSLQSVPGSSYPSSPPPSDPLLSQLVYQRDTRDKQTDRDLDSTRSSALESTEVRYLNDQPALDTLRTVANRSHPTGVRVSAREGAKEDSTPKAQFSQSMDSQESSSCVAPAPGCTRRGESTPSTSPGSASQRLENLRRHQPDDKLEKLKERIRRQRQHLEEAAEREKLLGYLEQPIMATVGSNNSGTSNMPSAKIRKVTAAPPAPIYKGIMAIRCSNFLSFILSWLNSVRIICEVILWSLGNTDLSRLSRTGCCSLHLQFLYFQGSTVLRQRSRLLTGKFGKKRSFITSVEKYTETCHDSLLVNTKTFSFYVSYSPASHKPEVQYIRIITPQKVNPFYSLFKCPSTKITWQKWLCWISWFILRIVV